MGLLWIKNVVLILAWDSMLVTLLHVINVALVLNLATGHVSPQPHLTFENDLSTVSYLNDETSLPTCSPLFLDATECLDVDQSLHTATDIIAASGHSSMIFFCTLPSLCDGTYEGNTREDVRNDHGTRNAHTRIFDNYNLHPQRNDSALNDSTKYHDHSTDTQFIELESISLRRSHWIKDIKE